MSRSRPYHHGDLKAALIQHALTALERAGAEDLSLRGLAEAAGVSRAAPYAHFSDKRALLAAIAATGFQQLTATMTAAKGEASPRARFMQVGRGYVEFALNNPNLFKMMFSRELGGLRDLEGLREAGEAAVDAFYASLSDFLTDARPEQAMTYADQALSWSHVHGLSLLLIEGRLPVPRSQTPALAEEVTTMFVDLLATGRARSPALALDFTRLDPRA